MKGDQGQNRRTDQPGKNAI